MPELPEVEAVRRMLERVSRGARIDRVELRRPDLRRPFPADFVARLTGRTILSVGRRGKYLVARLDSGDALLVHLGMTGDFRTATHDRARGDRPALDPHDHVVFTLSSGVVVTFNDPRRFGLMDLIRAREEHEALRAMGPEPLDDAFDAAALARALAGKRVSLKAALLDQRLVAGVGNIYASEALHYAGLSPRRRASTIATRGGEPREAAVALVAGVKAVLRRAVAANARAYESGRFRVYEREGRRCPRRGCEGRIRRTIQTGRSTYFCPRCQR